MLFAGQPVLEVVVQVAVDPDAAALVPVKLVVINQLAVVTQGTLEADPQQIAETIVEAAQQGGSKDNITAVVLLLE